MTHQPKPVVWTALPRERQCQLIHLLSQIALQQLASIPLTEDTPDERSNPATLARGRQDSRPAP